MRILFLDDNENRAERFLSDHAANHEVNWATTVKDAITLLEAFRYDEVWLDHDLGGQVFVDSGREDCGYEVVRWIVATKPTIGRIYIHTWNMPAGSRMALDLELAGYKVTFQPYTVVQ